MSRARTTWLLCRRSEVAPEGVTYWAGGADIVDCTLGGRVAVPPVTLFRDEAAEVEDEAAARLLADLFTALGPAPDAAPWEVLPAAIALPERQSNSASASDIAALRAAIFGPCPSEGR